MKKLLFSLFIILFAASTGWAIPTTNVPDGWTYGDTDTILGYESLHPSNEDEALAFANAVLAAYGMGPTELLNGTGERINFPDETDYKSIIYDPDFAWVYAVVKVDGPNDFSYLFMDLGDGILQTPSAGTGIFNTGNYGISNITWFGPAPVPEPSTMLLLGAGLVGIGFYARKRGKK